MIRVQNQVKTAKMANTGKQVHEAVMQERLAREDLWADLAGEELDDDVSFTLEVFDDLLSDTRDFND